MPWKQERRRGKTRAAGGCPGGLKIAPRRRKLDREAVKSGRSGAGREPLLRPAAPQVRPPGRMRRRNSETGNRKPASAISAFRFSNQRFPIFPFNCKVLIKSAGGNCFSHRPVLVSNACEDPENRRLPGGGRAGRFGPHHVHRRHASWLITSKPKYARSSSRS